MEPFVYTSEYAGRACGLAGPNAIAVQDNFAVWMGTRGFFMYDGFVRPIKCDVLDYLANNISQTQRSKVYAVANNQYGEVWWFYPSANNTECDSYVVYNYRENHWSIGSLARTAGTDRGNWCKINKPLAAYDADTDAVVAFLQEHPLCTGKLGAMGICIGGHLNFRACFHPGILAGVSFYATDIHKLEAHPRGLGLGMADDSLERARRGAVHGELLMIWGRQDPHVPFEGRMQIHRVLEEAGTNYQWLEFNAAHAFLRDEGPRYNPVLAQQSMQVAVELFHRKLGAGGLVQTPAAGAETRH